MDAYTFWNAVAEHIMVPALITIGAALVIVVKHFGDKIAKSIVAKNELAELEKKSGMRKQILDTIEASVQAAVASNMQLAEQMKELTGYLTEEQSAQLANTAKQNVYNFLPASLTKEGEPLNDIIGGTARLDSIIETSIEKHVYEYKIKKAQIKKDKGETVATEELLPVFNETTDDGDEYVFDPLDPEPIDAVPEQTVETTAKESKIHKPQILH